MDVTIVSSRQLNQNISRVKRVAQNNPVFITDRGRLAHVLMTIEQYRLVTSAVPVENHIGDLLAMPADGEYIDFETATLESVFKVSDHS